MLVEAEPQKPRSLKADEPTADLKVVDVQLLFCLVLRVAVLLCACVS